MKQTIRAALLFVVASAWIAACGARSSLKNQPARDGDGGRAVGGSGAGVANGGQDPEGGRGGSVGGEGGVGGAFGGMGGMPPLPCNGVTEQVCGSSVGECSQGLQFCQPDGFFGPCEGGVGPRPELCNGLDENCDGTPDDGFNLGMACDGADNDACFDDVVTCDGCSLGPDILETCNGVDDNCNGDIDSDCDVGSCSPTLLVTGSVPSSPQCIDFPVEAGSTGQIFYPCDGGPVTATLGAITFSGSVSANGDVALFGTIDFIGPDGCDWRADHSITGSVPSGTVQYFYEEFLLTMPQGNCWFPCTETGTVDIDWLP